MPHQSFTAVRTEAERDREPITFDFGPYGETFTVKESPSLGDSFDVMDAPEPTPQNLAQTARVLAKFIRRMLDPADQPRFDRVLYLIPATEAHLIVDAAAYIAAQVSGFPTAPSTSSSGGRQTSGPTSSPDSDGIVP